MPEDSSKTQPPGGEPEKIPGYVERKIRERKSSKEGQLVARARASQPRISTKKEEKLHDLLAPHLLAAVQAWVDGLKATKIAWNQQSHRFEDTGFPDNKVRAECARAIVEYVVGKAIERSMEVTGSYKELSTLIDEIKQSPEAMRLLPAGLFESLLNSEQSVAEGKDAAPGHEGEAISQPEQKTG
jgi:hypothetical protein